MFIRLEKRTKVLLDTDKEREHLANVFKEEDKEAVERQLAILDAVENGDLNEVVRLYDALPYSEVDECFEQEYTGLWLRDWADGRGEAKCNIILPRIITLTPCDLKVYGWISKPSKNFEEVEMLDLKVDIKETHKADIVEYRDGDKVKYLKHTWEQLDEFGNIIKKPKKQAKEEESEDY